MAPLINFSGLASGIDSSSLISAILDQQRAVRINPLQRQITATTETNSALGKLSELLNSLKGAADKFRTVNGSALSKNALSSDETILQVRPQSSAVNGTSTINVTQLAKNASFSFDDRFSDSNSIINSNIVNGAAEADRTVSITTGTGDNEETVDVILTNSTTLSEFVGNFNSQSTKAVATIINVGTAASPSYALSIASLSEGTDKGQISLSVGSGITDPNGDTFTTDGAFVTNTLNASTNAQDAQFTVTGVTGTITKSSNSISDVIPGLTLELKNLGTATLTVSDDPAGTSSTIKNFVDAYNSLVSFVTENDLVSVDESDQQERSVVFGPLASTSLDDNLLTSLRSAFTGASTTGRAVNTLADLGITTKRDGTLAFDSAKLQEAISEDPEAVRLITVDLGETLAAVDGTIAQYTRFNGLIDVAENSNKATIDTLNKRISAIEQALGKQEEALFKQYARLESLIGQLQQQQNSLGSLIPNG